MTIKRMQLFDIEDLLEFDRQSNAHIDKDFDYEVWPNALKREDLLNLISQIHDEEKGTLDTRSFTISNNDNVLGGFVYEILPRAFHVEWFTIDRTLDGAGDVFRSMLDFLIRKADNSDKRKTIRIILRDSDASGMRILIPILKEFHFLITLKRDYFGRDDAWEAELTIDSLASI